MTLQMSRVPGAQRNQLLGRMGKWGGWKWKFRQNVSLGKSERKCGMEIQIQERTLGGVRGKM